MFKRFLFLSACLASAATCVSAEALPPYPTAPAPFARSGAARQPVKMDVRAFSYGTNLWQAVEFVSGTKRLLVSGADREIDCNDPLRFGRLFLVNGRRVEASLVLRTGGLWDGWAVGPEDLLKVEPEKNRATWSRPYLRPDGRRAVFSYAVTGLADGTATIDYDMGLTQEEALAQPKALPVSGMFSIGGKVSPACAYGFGSHVHRPYPREKLLADKLTQWHEAIENPDDTNVFNFERGNDLRHWSVAFPRPWLKGMRMMDYLGEIRDGRLERGGALHYDIADFRNGNPKGLSVKGRIVIDFGKSAELERQPLPPVGGIDFWGADALHVPVPLTRNLLLNGNFEQGFKGWRWDDWGAVYNPAEKLREEIVTESKIGRRALLLRGTQPRCPALCSAPMPLVAGRRYTLSCQAKSLNGRSVKFGFNVRSVNQNGKYWQFRAMEDFPSRTAGSDWTRHAVSFTADAGGFFVWLSPPWGADEGVLIDGIQVEEGETATDFTAPPYEARLLAYGGNGPLDDCDLRSGERLDLRLQMQPFGEPRKGSVRVRILNFYGETKYDRTHPLDGAGDIALGATEAQLGKGVFVVRLDYACGDLAWTDYARFCILAPHAVNSPMARFYANHGWYERVSMAEKYCRKFTEWGWSSTDGAGAENPAIRTIERKYGIRNYVHPVTYSRAKMAEVAKRMLTPESAEAFLGDMRKWEGVRPDWLAAIEQLAYELASECDAEEDIWTFWNEEEDWARRVGFAAHVEYVTAVRRGVGKAFAERGLPPPKFSESHGTSHYFAGRNYDAIDGYLKAAADKGFRYDVVTVHPYQNIDGGTLGPKDADLETQHLIDQLKSHGYPDSTPIMFTESFNMSPFRIPEWGADGWNDSYRCNTQPSLDRGQREFVMAASQARLYLVNLKYWPKLQLVHPWNCAPILDLDFSPLSHLLSVNTLRHLLPSPVFFGDAQPYADVRAYCFRQGDHAVMAVWTTDHDVEWGVKKGPVVRMDLPADTRVYDLEGNGRRADGRVPLTPAPLFFVSSDADRLLRAAREAVADDPSTALRFDVRPDASGAVSLIVRNATKSVQKGSVTVAGKDLAYDLGPRAETSFKVASGRKAPLVPQTWSGRVSLLPNPWKLDYFLVPKCGEKPDWKKLPVMPLTTVKPESGWTDPGFRASCQAAWNDRFFFVRVEVEDPSYVEFDDKDAAFDPKALYAHDGAIEIYFDGFADARSQGEKDYDLNDSRYDFCGDHVHRLVAVNWQLAQGTASATDEEIREKLVRSFTRTAKGYVYETAFAARYMAPIDLKAGTVAGFGVAVHDYDAGPEAERRNHATFSNASREGCDLDRKPYLMPVMVLTDQSAMRGDATSRTGP